MTAARRLLVVCGEPLGARMAGPAIRAVELSRVAAAAGVEVTIAAPAGEGAAPLGHGVNRIPLSNGSLRAELRATDCVLVGANLMGRFPSLATADVPLAVDLYDPVLLEAVELFRDAPAQVADATLAAAAANLRLEVGRADVVFCASDRQRELWLGAMLAAGRLSADEYRDDPALAGLCRVMPFGVADGWAARADRPVLRGVHAGIGTDDPIAIWGGGLHDWFDPELVVQATGLLLGELPNLRLVFLGGAAPNAALQAHGAAERTRRAAEAAGLLDRNVFLLPGWVPYRERGAYLAEADIGVSAHLDTAETRYAWRTRLLDYAWARLPVAATSGDALSERLSQAGAAELAAPGDAAGLAAAIRTLLTDPPRRERAVRAAAEVAEDLRWPRVAQPLLDWIERPERTAGSVGPWAATLSQWRMYAAKGWHVLRQEGPSGVSRRAGRYRDRG